MLAKQLSKDSIASKIEENGEVAGRSCNTRLQRRRRLRCTGVITNERHGYTQIFYKHDLSKRQPYDCPLPS